LSKSDWTNVRGSTARIERFIKTEGIVISKARVWGESKELFGKLQATEEKPDSYGSNQHADRT
jgi:hypothetical protein